MEDSKELLKAAAQLERDVSKLYLLYSDIFTGDSDFWRQIAKEEVEHAALIEMAIEYPDVFPKGLAIGELSEIKKISSEVRKRIEEYKKRQPSLNQACKYALNLESSAWELHYQKLATRIQDSDAIKIFQKINDGDKDHMQRISKYCSKQ